MSHTIVRFEFRPANSNTIPVFETVRAAVTDLARILDEQLPDGQKAALAITQLEQVQFWSNPAIESGYAKGDVHLPGFDLRRSGGRGPHDGYARPSLAMPRGC